MDDSEIKTMDDLEKALENIDVFCKVLVQKIKEDENCSETCVLKPIEDLLRLKYQMDELEAPTSLAGNFISLPHLDEPLIDVFEDDNYVKVLMQCRCRDQSVTVHRETDGLKICTNKCQKLNLPTRNLQIEKMIAKCNNNEVLEISIPKKLQQS